MTVVLKTNLLVLGGLTILLGSSLVSGLVQLSDAGEEKVRMALVGAGVSASLIVDPERLSTMTPESVETPAYQSQEAALKTLAETFGLSDLYVLRPAGNSWQFIFDTADGPLDPAASDPKLSLYEEHPPELDSAWKGGTPVVTGLPYTDEYGTFRSAFVPLLDHQDHPVAVVGTDFNLAQLNLVREQRLTLSLFLALGGLVLVALLAGTLVRMIGVPLKLVSSRFTALADGRADFTERVPVRSRDELGDLAAGFNAFVEKMGVLVVDLQTGVGETVEVQKALLRDSEQTVQTMAQFQQDLAGLSSSGARLETLADTVLANLESIAAQSSRLDALARSEGTAADQVALCQQALDQEAVQLKREAHAVGQALAELDIESAENTRRTEQQLESLNRLAGAVDAVHGIVATLTATADSTALLAMNASIEAAHAGALGRGFAVIAQRMRQQAQTSRTDADRIGATLEGMIALIGEAAQGAKKTVEGAESTHDRIESAQSQVDRLTQSGDRLEALARENQKAVIQLKATSGGVAGASGAVAAETVAITASTRTLQEVSSVVAVGTQSLFQGSQKVGDLVEDTRQIARSLSTVSTSLEENLLRIRVGSAGSQPDQP